MTALTALWLPILLSAVFVFIASAIIHMLPLWHKGDYPAPPNQDQVADALRPMAIPRGEYMLPRPPNMAAMKSPEFQERIAKGPVMIMTVMPNERMGMGKPLALWFVFCLVISYFAAYITGRALAPGASYLEVFRFAGATAFIGYAAALWQMSIWYSRSWTMTIKETIDALIYALLTAGVFGWLWPR